MPQTTKPVRKTKTKAVKRGRPPVPHILIRAGVVLTPDKEIRRGAVLIKGRRIVAVGRDKEIAAAVRKAHDRSDRFTMDVVEAPDLIAIPGLIDIHQHGGGGADYIDGTVEAARTVLETHVRGGTTSVLPTMMTASRPALKKALASVDALRPRGERGSLPATAEAGPDILGIHLEGPFISKKRHGAQPPGAVRRINKAEIQEYLRIFRTPIRLMTLAPELPGAPAFIKFLVRRGIIASAGHSDASFEEAIRGFDAGISHGTHLFNAMRGFFHREPGLAGALLLNEQASVELIADGRHLHPAAVFLALQAKPADKVVFVTDASRNAGTKEAPLLTAEGGLFGGNLCLLETLLKLMEWSGWSLQDVLPLATSNPARVLGLEKRKGTLLPGADADIVLLDYKFQVKDVWCAGRRASVFEKKQ